jgi:hypothetical protein
MKEVERERLEHDAQEIEHDIEVDDDDAAVCDETNNDQSTLFGHPRVGHHQVNLRIGSQKLVHQGESHLWMM